MISSLVISSGIVSCVGAQVRLHDGAAPAFIKAAVAKAVAMGYDGYNFDNELRGSECLIPIVPMGNCVYRLVAKGCFIPHEGLCV